MLKSATHGAQAKDASLNVSNNKKTSANEVQEHVLYERPMSLRHTV